MTLLQQQRDELYNLLDLLFDEQLDGTNHRRLSELLAESEEAQWIYIAELNLHANMAWDWGVLKTCGDGETPCGEVDQSLEGSGLGDSLFQPPLSVPIPSIVIQSIPSVQPSAFSLNAPLGGMLFSYAVSALLVCLGMLVGWTWTVSEPQLAAVKNAPVQESKVFPFVPKMAIVGRISGMIDCFFSEDKDILPPPGNNAYVPLGRKYKLNSGLMEITYDSGAKVILQGPAAFEVESASGGFLSIGRLTAKIEKGEKSRTLDSQLSPLPSPLFFVRTPTVLVTDLGTEFGVDVDRSGLTASHVFRGRVVVSTLDDGGEKQGNELILGENESFRAERQSGGDGSKIVMRRAPVAPGDFVRSEQFAAKAKEAKDLPMKPFHRWKAFSDELRQRDDLLAYYDFQRDPNDRRDATNSEVLRNRAKSGRPYDGQLRGAVQWAQGRCAGKHALRFGFSDDDGVHVNIPEECKKATLAAWVNLESISRPICSILSSDGFNANGKVHWLVYQDGRMSVGYFGFTKDMGGFSLPTFDAPGLGKWRFVATVLDPTEGKFLFYLNGKLLSELPLEARAGTVNLGPTMIGAWEPLNIGCARDRRLEGRMDELMIFRAALSPEDIQKIYEGTKE